MSLSIPHVGPSIARVVKEFIQEGLSHEETLVQLSCSLKLTYCAQAAIAAAGGSGGGGLASTLVRPLNIEVKLDLKVTSQKDPGLALLKKISGLFQKIALLADEAEGELEFGLICRNNAAKLVGMGQKVDLPHAPMPQILYSLYEEGIFAKDEAHFEELEAAALHIPPGIKFKDFKLHSSNVISDFSSKEEVDQIHLYFISEFLRKKGEPLSPSEFTMARKIAEDASWKGARSGLCAGISHGFNGFILSRLLEKEVLPSVSTLLDEFEASSFYQKACVTQLIEFWTPGRFVLERGEIVQKAPSFLSKSSIWPRVQNHLELSFPKLNVYSRQQEERFGLLLQLEEAEFHISSFADACGMTASSIMPSAGACAAILGSMHASGAINPLSILPAIANQQKLRAALAQQARQTCAQSFGFLRQIASVHDSFACKIGYLYPDSKGGHAVSIVMSQSNSLFLFYDSNSSLISFHSASDLFNYAERHLEDNIEFELIFMMPK